MEVDMSCDMHAFIERPYTGSDDYQAIAKVFIDRDYEFFGMIAGVREEELIVFEPRGIPSDASIETCYQYACEESDAHTPSWLTAEEIRQIEERADWTSNEHLFAMMRALPDSRIVFWFDN
jgi:hypothetical protein